VVSAPQAQFKAPKARRKVRKVLDIRTFWHSLFCNKVFPCHRLDAHKRCWVMMKKLLLLTLICMTSGFTLAQDTGVVLSSTPVMQQVAVPRQVCTSDQVEVQGHKSGVGAAIGAIAGGALGNSSARGPGRGAATVIGALGGAVIGDRIEGDPEPRMQNIQRCSTQNFMENRVTAYNVVYEFAGQRYSVQMPNDPGPSIPVQVSPIGVNAVPSNPNAGMVQPQYIYTQPSPAIAPVIIAQPTYPVYYARPYYAPLALGLGVGMGIGYWGGYPGGYRHHGQGPWQGHRR